MEGRKVRNTRRARAMGKKTRYGQKEQEDAWLNAEVDALYRLPGAVVRVPEPFGFVDGVLLMEMIADKNGKVIADVVRMLSAGLVRPSTQT